MLIYGRIRASNVNGEISPSMVEGRENEIAAVKANFTEVTKVPTPIKIFKKIFRSLRTSALKSRRVLSVQDAVDLFRIAPCCSSGSPRTRSELM